MDRAENLKEENRTICRAIERTNDQLIKLLDEAKKFKFLKLKPGDKRKITQGIDDLKRTAEEIEGIIKDRENVVVITLPDMISDISSICNPQSYAVNRKKK